MRDTAEGGDGVVAVVLAGGASTRFDHGTRKVHVGLGGRPVLAWSVDTLERSRVVDHVVLVVRAGDQAATARAVAPIAPSKLRAVVVGGATRHDSEAAGLDAAADIDGVGWVLLHDAARPFVTLDLLERLVATAQGRGVGAVPGLPVDTPLVDPDGVPVDTSALITVQTPQVFALSDVAAAFRAAAAEGFHGVDTAATVAAYSDTTVEHVPGDPRNQKVTTIDDLATAEAAVTHWRGGAWHADAVGSPRHEHDGGGD